MDKYKCNMCDYVYDPALGDPTQDIAAGTKFADLPASWICPDCGAQQDQFEII